MYSLPLSGIAQQPVKVMLDRQLPLPTLLWGVASSRPVLTTTCLPYLLPSIAARESLESLSANQPGSVHDFAACRVALNLWHSSLSLHLLRRVKRAAQSVR